jgi:hypothetical protein
MRTTLRVWGSNTKKRGDCPEDAALTLSWLSRNTKPVAALADPALTRSQAAEWAGHRVAVLLRIYAKCIEGQDKAARRRIEEALRDDEENE